MNAIEAVTEQAETVIRETRKPSRITAAYRREMEQRGQLRLPEFDPKSQEKKPCPQ